MFTPESIHHVDLLEASAFVQEILDEAPPDQVLDTWETHRALIGNEPEYHGAKRIHLRTEGALMLPDGLSAEEAIYPILEYDEMAMTGWLGSVNMVRMNGEAIVLWRILNAKIHQASATEAILDPDSAEDDLINPLPLDRPLKRPIYAPAKLIAFAMCAD